MIDDEMTPPINPLSDEKLKERMNFAKMMQRQQDQIKETTHVSNLIKPNQDNTSNNELYRLICTLENKISRQNRFSFSLKELNRKQMYFLFLCFAIAGFTYALSSRAKPEVQYKEKIVYKRKKLPEKFYLTKYVNIRAQASTKAKKMTTLPPNSIIEIIKEKGDWKKIKFRDYTNQKDLIGWAYGENLKKITSSF